MSAACYGPDMVPLPRLVERIVTKRVFEAWSIDIPVSFAETFVDEGSYWHAYDEGRSVSLTSIVITDKRGAVSAKPLARRLPQVGGSRVEEIPDHLAGWAVTADADQPARAGRLLTGMLAAEGRALVVTITSDDLDWAKAVWLSIRHHRARLPSRREQRAAMRTHRRPR
jgi:hypothetical protein